MADVDVMNMMKFSMSISVLSRTNRKTGSTLAKYICKRSFKKNAEIGIDINQIGGRGRKNYPVHAVWAALGAGAKRVAQTLWDPIYHK